MSHAVRNPVADPTAIAPPVAASVNPDIPTSATVTSHRNLTRVGESAKHDYAKQVPGTKLIVGASPAAQATAKSSKSKKKKSQVIVTMATATTAQAGAQGSQGENTGRWTAEEHRLFLQGLELHGKGWKKIASLIKSRTVVQIRTHAQKYFQKLAKARQNGEEGDVPMEGRGGTAALPSVSSAAGHSSKRRRQTSGTKRKAIQSVVSSAQRQGKKIGAGPATPTPTLPSVAPALAPYVVTEATIEAGTTQPLPSITTAQGTISGHALEDSLFRFLTPAPVSISEPQLNEVARQAGANPITLPTDQVRNIHEVGEVSPTGVADFAMYPSWTDAKDTPSWYAKGSDVDALLDVADTLDWLTDTGDLQETYQASHSSDQRTSVNDQEPNKVENDIAGTHSAHNMSLNTLQDGDVVVPPLPSLFDTAAEPDELSLKKSESGQLTMSASSTTIDEDLQVFDTPLEEHDFVSTILEETGDSTNTLLALG
ncbi:unnamed protein product [Cylindrotheca closterium]|uniref:Uncharacterized protein n=1 Tax=Cylindrotheca closterium TaxID=2856 RepID=A0AAD2CMU2_9STRA|nr:unnamed protein product [Cylindrotheca closterium]